MRGKGFDQSFFNRFWSVFLYYVHEILSGDMLNYAGMRLKGIDLARSCLTMSSGGPSLERILDTLRIEPDDSIIDIGSGKGGAIIIMAKYPFKKIAGVELSPKLVKIAKENLVKMGIAGIILHCCDAIDFPGLDEFNYVYLYNPLPCQIMKEFMDIVSKSIIRCPRELTIIYSNPVCHETILENSLFKQVARIASIGHTCNIYRNVSHLDPKLDTIN